MALIGSGKDIVKKDMNFFAAFTESARKTAQILLMVILVCLVFVGIFVIWWLYWVFSNMGVRSEIKNLQTELAKPEYADLEVESQNLQNEINERNQYYYALTEMRKMVDMMSPADTALIDLLGTSIPNDSYVSDYELTGSEFDIYGYSFTYYGALNMVNILQDSDVFYNPLNIRIEHVNLDDVASGSTEEMTTNPLDAYYSFEIIGNIKSDAYISVAKYVNIDGQIIAIGGIDTSEYAIGSSFEISEIGSVEYNGVVYTLGSVEIDKVPVSDDTLNAIIANDSVTGTAMGDSSIALYYEVSQVAEETEEGGEEK
ncbi:MAG TPA: hypothetical protein DCW41_04795 [Clostridiales bacterium]|nr:hypothetical protein [Clostridiales bacterium]